MLTRQDICDRPGLLEPEHALARILSFVQPIEGAEEVALIEATGRITISAIRSKISLPPFDQSAVDGYAILDRDIADARTVLTRVGRVAAGSPTTQTLTPGETVKLLTGAAIPPGVDAVVMEEKVQLSGDRVTLRAATPGLNIRRKGEDVQAGSEIIGAGAVLDARHIAILAASGINRLFVRRRLRVAVLSTGDELIASGTTLESGQLHDANGPMLMSLLRSPAIQIDYLGRAPDDRAALQEAFTGAASSYDLVLSSGGVSGSDADHVVPAIQDAGGECQAMSLALKPGKPLAAGRLGSTPILALPGNPVAAMVGALLFARPLIEALIGAVSSKRGAIAARTAKPFEHGLGRAEFVPVAITGFDEQGTPHLEKLGRGGSARLRPLILADGLARIPGNVGNLGAGDPVSFYPFKAQFGL